MRLRFPRSGPRRQLSCRQVGQILQRYLDGALDADAAALVTHHLDDCRRCGLEAETYRALKDVLARGSGDLGDGTLARLREFGARLARGELDPDDLATR